MKLLIHWFLTTIAIVLGAYFLPGVNVANFVTALIVAFVLGLLNTLLKPLLLLITLPLNLLSFGLFTFVINGVIILLVSFFVPGFHIANFIWAILFSIFVSIITSLLQHFVE